MSEIMEQTTRQSRAYHYRQVHFDSEVSQIDMALDYLEMYGSITPIEALEAFGAFRLSDIIFKLRKQGYPITTRTNTGKKKYAIYELVDMEGEE